MFRRFAVVRTGLMSLPLMFGACSVTPYHPTQPLDRAVPAPAAEVAEIAPPLAPLVPDGLASSPSVAPGAPATAAPSDPFILERVALTARRMVGIPYHYGGNDSRGFYCWGVVFYGSSEDGVLVGRA